MTPERADHAISPWAIFAALVLMSVSVRVLVADSGRQASDFPVTVLLTPWGEMEAALADTTRRRGIGYRNISAQQAPRAIYFRYPSPRPVTFDMRAVRFPVRAYWIAPDHCISGWSEMQPGDGGHDSPAEVIAVLELPQFHPRWRDLAEGDCIREK